MFLRKIFYIYLLFFGIKEIMQTRTKMTSTDIESLIFASRQSTV